ASGKVRQAVLTGLVAGGLVGGSGGAILDGHPRLGNNRAGGVRDNASQGTAIQLGVEGDGKQNGDCCCPLQFFHFAPPLATSVASSVGLDNRSLRSRLSRSCCYSETARRSFFRSIRRSLRPC